MRGLLPFLLTVAGCIEMQSKQKLLHDPDFKEHLNFFYAKWYQMWPSFCYSFEFFFKKEFMEGILDIFNDNFEATDISELVKTAELENHKEAICLLLNAFNCLFSSCQGQVIAELAGNTPFDEEAAKGITREVFMTTVPENLKNIRLWQLYSKMRHTKSINLPEFILLFDEGLSFDQTWTNFLLQLTSAAVAKISKQDLLQKATQLKAIEKNK